ncbi:MAG: Enoyl-CoA hydratase [Polaromonas sp.]|jgi:enoyl-CoA hydratase/carnithine racemase|nr:Enoyl-CoA hydratase [Polaromonas sp.]
MAGALQSTSEDCTLILTITNPEFKNALGPEIYAAGIEALNAAENNADIRSVVITGANGTFCAGGNLQKLLANRREVPEVQAQSIEGLHNWIDCIRTYPKPVIAAVEGAAAGAGFSLAMACDLCVAAEDAVFVMAYSSVALSPDGGGSWALARSLPRALASEIMMFGERIDAPRLYAAGLINRVVPPGTALAQAQLMAEHLNNRAPNALASIKELINGASTDSLSQHLANERDHFVRNLHHVNAGEGISSFLQKLKPHYR